MNNMHLTALVLLPLLAAAVGCSEQSGTPYRQEKFPTHDLQIIDMTPTWRTFALSHYQSAVNTKLKAPGSARYDQEPKIEAVFDRTTNETGLKATGHVDSQNSFGALLRSGYYVLWKVAGNASLEQPDWRLVGATVFEGNPLQD